MIEAFLIGAVVGAVLALWTIRRYADREGRAADLLRRVTRP